MNKLKLPLWSDIVYLLLTVVAPIVFIVIEAMKVPSASFRISFTVCSASIIAYVMIRKFIIDKYINKLSSQCATVELNYQTDVGDPEKNKTFWVKSKVIEYVFSIIQIVLVGSLILLIVWGLQTLGLKLRGTTIFIFLLYLVAFAFRIVMYLGILQKKNNSDKVDSEQKQ